MKIRTTQQSEQPSSAGRKQQMWAGYGERRSLQTVGGKVNQYGHDGEVKVELPCELMTPLLNKYPKDLNIVY